MATPQPESVLDIHHTPLPGTSRIPTPHNHQAGELDKRHSFFSSHALRRSTACIKYIASGLNTSTGGEGQSDAYGTSPTAIILVEYDFLVLGSSAFQLDEKD